MFQIRYEWSIPFPYGKYATLSDFMLVVVRKEGIKMNFIINTQTSVFCSECWGACSWSIRRENETSSFFAHETYQTKLFVLVVRFYFFECNRCCRCTIRCFLVLCMAKAKKSKLFLLVLQGHILVSNCKEVYVILCLRERRQNNFCCENYEILMWTLFLSRNY